MFTQFFNAFVHWVDQNRPIVGLAFFSVLGLLVNLQDRAKRQTVWQEYWVRLRAYLVVLTVAQGFDWITAPLLKSGAIVWPYGTFFLSSLFLACQEAYTLLTFAARQGVRIPFLQQRLGTVMELGSNEESVAEIRRLVAELKTMRENRPLPSDDTSSNGIPTI